jgi:hypothetical protein
MKSWLALLTINSAFFVSAAACVYRHLTSIDLDAASIALEGPGSDFYASLVRSVQLRAKPGQNDLGGIPPEPPSFRLPSRVRRFDFTPGPLFNPSNMWLVHRILAWELKSLMVHLPRSLTLKSQRKSLPTWSKPRSSPAQNSPDPPTRSHE